MESNDAVRDQAENQKKKGKTPFAQLSSKDKILRIITLCLSAAVFLACVVAGIYFMIAGDPDNRILPSFGVALLAVLPYAIELVFRTRLSSFMLLFVYIFMFFAGFLGCSMNWYNIYAPYDKIIHGIFGYVGCAIGLFAIVKTKNYGGLNVFGLILFVFAFSMACGAIWEIIEFTADNLMGAHGQGFPMTGITESGEIVTGVIDVSDTMTDIIMNFIGAVVFSVHLLLHRLTKKDLFLGTAIENFASN